jgi:microcystin-dependent protein
MTYTPHTWIEYASTGGWRANWLNNAETQYDEGANYCDVTTHDATYYLKAAMNAKYFGPANQGSGSGFICGKLDGYTAVQLLDAGIPAYSIILWAGDLGSIPTGFHLCDGRNAYTPDLTDRFPLGAGGAYSVNNYGGSNTVTSTASTVTIGTHVLTTAEIPAHKHTIAEDWDSSYYLGYGAGLLPAEGPTSQNNSSYTEYAGGGAAHGHTGSTLTGAGTTGNNMPPYRAYYYIIKEP